MTIRKNRTFTITFAAIDDAARPARKTGLTFSAGDTKISIDGGSFANTTNNPAEIATASGRYSLVLTAAEMDADNIHIFVEKTGMDPVDYYLQTDGQPSGVVVTDGANTSATFETDLSESTDDYWKDALLLMTSGTLDGQIKKVTAYDGTTKFITLGTSLTATPTGDDRFVLVNF